MAIIGQGVSLEGMYHNDFHYPFLLAATVTAANVGAPMALDETAPNTAKVAADGEQIIGKLVTFEDRAIEGIRVGTITLRGGFAFPIAAAATVAVGDTLVGAGAGRVRAAATANHADNFVVEVDAVARIATIVR